MASGLHVSISAETLGEIAGIPFTNSMFTGSIVTLLLLLFIIIFASSTKKSKPTGLQNFVETIIEALYNLTKDIAGEKKARVFFPLVATSFIFILLNNWSGLLPGVGTIGITHDSQEFHVESIASPTFAMDHGVSGQEAVTTHSKSTTDPELHQTETTPSHSSESNHVKFIPLFRAATADLNTTLALAIVSVFLTQFYGFKFLGLSYLKKFFNFTQGPIFTFVGILELISEFAKIISFAFRLFGNIFAGEVLLAVISYLIPIFAPLPFLGLEIFVGAVQALVFAMLTLVFTNMATISHDDH